MGFSVPTRRAGAFHAAGPPSVRECRSDHNAQGLNGVFAPRIGPLPARFESSGAASSGAGDDQFLAAKEHGREPRRDAQEVNPSKRGLLDGHRTSVPLGTSLTHLEIAPNNPHVAPPSSLRIRRKSGSTRPAPRSEYEADRKVARCQLTHRVLGSTRAASTSRRLMPAYAFDQPVARAHSERRIDVARTVDHSGNSYERAPARSSPMTSVLL